MGDRRSGRSRKVIDYTKLGFGDSDNDDDFQEKVAPSNKRKKAEYSPKSMKVKLTKIEVDFPEKDSAKSDSKHVPFPENDTCKKRLSVNDKVFQRQLNAALEISKKQAKTEFNDNDDHSGNEKSSKSRYEKQSDSEVETHSDSGGDEKHSDSGDEKHSDSGDEKHSDSGDEKHSDSGDEKHSDSGDEKHSGSGDEKHSGSGDEKHSGSGGKKQSNSVDNKHSDSESAKYSDSEEESSSGEGDQSDSDNKEELDSESSNDEMTKSEPKKRILKLKLHNTKPPQTIASKKRGRAPKETSAAPPRATSQISCKVISSPVKLPAKGLRLGLSRKVGSKPLHSTIKLQV